jgi:hypothetical protein
MCREDQPKRLTVSQLATLSHSHDSICPAPGSNPVNKVGSDFFLAVQWRSFKYGRLVTFRYRQWDKKRQRADRNGRRAITVERARSTLQWMELSVAVVKTGRRPAWFGQKRSREFHFGKKKCRGRVETFWEYLMSLQRKSSFALYFFLLRRERNGWETDKMSFLCVLESLALRTGRRKYNWCCMLHRAESIFVSELKNEMIKSSSLRKYHYSTINYFPKCYLSTKQSFTMNIFSTFSSSQAMGIKS